jgi:hypothetical protein
LSFFFLPFLTDHREKHEDWMQMPRRVRFVFHLRTVNFFHIFRCRSLLRYSDPLWYHLNEFGMFLSLIIIFRFVWAAYLLEGHAIFPRGEWRSSARVLININE